MKVATLNLRNDKDRWAERFGLVVQGILQELPDIIALQEVALSIHQAESIADAVNSQLTELTYQVSVAKCWGPEITLGEAILSRYPKTRDKETRLPGQYDGQPSGRVAHLVSVSDGTRQVNVVNTHLHHLPKDDEAVRFLQIQFLLDWMFRLGSENAPWIFMGDMNAKPNSRTVQYISKRFKSAYRTYHGTEPEYTFPTPLVAQKESCRSDWYEPRAIDYIFFSATALRVEEAHLAFTHSHSKDHTLFPSDHFGLVATFGW